MVVGLSTSLTFLYPGWGQVLTQAVGDLGSLSLGQEELNPDLTLPTDGYNHLCLQAGGFLLPLPSPFYLNLINSL